MIRRPKLVFGLSLAPLLPLALLGTQITANFKPIGDLSQNSQSVKGLGVIQSHFTAGETGPLTVLLVSKTDWASPEGSAILNRLSEGFSHLRNVAEVRSYTHPLGEPLGEPPTRPKKPNSDYFLWDHSRHGLYWAQWGVEKAQYEVLNFAAKGHYTTKIQKSEETLYVTRLEVVFNSDPFEPQSIETLEVIENWLRNWLPVQSAAVPIVKTETFGVTVHTRDMSQVVAKDRRLVNLLVVAGVLGILIILVRRVWLAGYLLGTVLLSYYATLGLTAIFTMWLTGKPFGVIEWRVPFFLFTILVAIGEDYNILLMTRILQERKRYGLVEGTRRGLATTGGTITACGVIMAGTFGTLMLADLSTLRQIGFALAIGVLLDTYLVRPFLVPSFILMCWTEPDSIAVRKRMAA